MAARGVAGAIALRLEAVPGLAGHGGVVGGLQAGQVGRVADRLGLQLALEGGQPLELGLDRRLKPGVDLQRLGDDRPLGGLVVLGVVGPRLDDGTQDWLRPVSPDRTDRDKLRSCAPGSRHQIAGTAVTTPSESRSDSSSVRSMTGGQGRA